MANYSYVINSSFRPFSMQEQLVPFELYKDAFEKDEERYIDLQNKADAFSYLAKDLPEGSKAREIYEGYANDLKKYSDDFYANGLDIGNRRGLSQMRGRYQGEIGRLVKADANRKADILEQRQISLQDPTRMFSKDAQITSLDDYLDGERMSYKSYSGAMLAQQVGTAASAIAKSLTNYGNGKGLDKFTSTWIQQHGFTPQQVADAISNPQNPNSSPVLRTLMDSVINSSGIPSWGDPAILKQAYSYASQGLWQAIGQTQVGTYENYGARLAAQEAAKAREQAREHAYRMKEAQAAAAQQNSLKFGRPHTDILSVLTGGKIDPKYSKFVTKDGRLLNATALMKALNGVSPYIYDPKTKKWRIKTEKEFKQFADKKYFTSGMSPGYNPHGIEAARVNRDRAVNSFKDFRNMLKNAGIGDNNIDIHYDKKKGFKFNPYSYNVVNTRLSNLTTNGAVNGWQDTGVFTLPLNESGERKLRSFINTHPNQVKELNYVSSDGKNRTYKWKGKYSLGKDDSISQLNYDPFSNQMTAVVGDGKMVSIPMSILSVADRHNIQVQSNIMRTSPGTADAALAYQNVYDLFLGALEEYGTVNRSTMDYQQ